VLSLLQATAVPMVAAVASVTTVIRKCRIRPLWFGFRSG
jgi:hypothetical protein